MEKKSMGKFIAALRRANGMTQSELAEKLFVSDKAVSRWERDESMPDITLVPLLANIFGVTADEILCGERITMPFASDTTENGSSVRDVLRKQEENQLEKQLKQRLTHFKMMSAVSVGITLFCLLIAAVCLLAFDAKKLNEAVLGGCIALTGVLVAIVYQICVTYSSLFVDGNDEKTVQVRLYNGRLASTAKNYFLFLLFCLGGSIPIFSAQRNPDGIDNGNYNFALICIALALGFVFATIGYFVYRLRIEKSLAKSGKITFDKKEITIKSLKNKYTLPCFFIAVGLIAACVVSLFFLSDFHFARAHVFDNKEDFIAYMELQEEGDYVKPDEESPGSAGGCSYDDYGFYYLTVKDRWVEIEGSYPQEDIVFYACNTSVKGYVPHRVGTPLPIRVYEEKDYQAGKALRWTTIVFTPILAVTDVVIGTVLYRKKLKTSK